jgi:hypothetical protein
MPDVAAVITATLPSSFPISTILSLSGKFHHLPDKMGGVVVRFN